MPVVSLGWLKGFDYDVLSPQTELVERGKFQHSIIVWDKKLEEAKQVFIFQVNPEEFVANVAQLAEPTKVVEGYNVQSWGEGMYTLSLNGNVGPIYKWLSPSSDKRIAKTFIWEQIRKIEEWTTLPLEQFEPTLSLYYPYGIHSNRKYEGFFSSFKISETAETFNVYNLSAEFIAVKVIPTTWVK